MPACYLKKIVNETGLNLGMYVAAMALVASLAVMHFLSGNRTVSNILDIQLTESTGAAYLESLCPNMQCV